MSAILVVLAATVVEHPLVAAATAASVLAVAALLWLGASFLNWREDRRWERWGYPRRRRQ